ncbi:hypothetical protein DMA11_14275 [Marinilabiliaceae bacterium JC017]|nr:hypothetical protein DMA11_14275 [Marinilabiliaceae bacterium JC017]
MGNNKKVILIPCCVLSAGMRSNTQASLDELGEIIKVLHAFKTGVISLPCPYFSLVRATNDEPVCFASKITNTFIEGSIPEDNSGLYWKILDPVISQIESYKKQGVQVVGLIGVKDSPSCSVNRINDNQERCYGQFIKTLVQRLKESSMSLNMADILLPG